MNNVFENFKAVVKASFSNVKNDMDDLKRSVTDWILYLDSNQRDLQIRVTELEKELRELKKQRQMVEVF